MLLARVDRLPQEMRRLAQEAAVIGPRFDAALLKAVTADPARLEAGLELLCDAEIIEEVAGSGSISSQGYRFTQTLAAGRDLSQPAPATPYATCMDGSAPPSSGLPATTPSGSRI